MVSSGKVSCIVFIMHIEYPLVHVNVCVDACTCTCGCKCKCDNMHSCTDTYVVPPIVVGVWPMAGTLWRLFEYYYYLLVTVFKKTIILCTSFSKHYLYVPTKSCIGELLTCCSITQYGDTAYMGIAKDT